MNKNLLPVLSLIFALLSSFASTSLWAANPNLVNKQFATLEVTGSSIIWAIHPDVQYKSITLTLSSADEVWSTTTTIDPSVDLLIDGSYSYELVVNPLHITAVRGAENGRKATEAVLDPDNQEKIPVRRQVQSGSFTILGGQFVSSDDDVEE